MLAMVIDNYDSFTYNLLCSTSESLQRMSGCSGMMK